MGLLRKKSESKVESEKIFGHEAYKAPGIGNRVAVDEKEDTSSNQTVKKAKAHRRYVAKVGHMMGLLARNPTISLAIGIVATVGMTFVGAHLTTSSGYPAYATASQFIFADYDGLEVTWNNREVSNLAMVEIVLWNDGNHFIDGRNFVNDVPIVIREFNRLENVRIISASIKNESRESLDFDLKVRNDQDSDYLEVFFDRKDALEVSEGIRVKVLYTTDSSKDLCACEWIIESRIKGFPDGFKKQTWFDAPELLMIE